MSSPWIFICPSSRGIGHALTRHLLLHTHQARTPILATTRHTDPNVTKAALLKDLAGRHDEEELSQRLSVVRCDVSDEASVAAAARRAAELFPPGKGGYSLRLACVMPGVLLRPERALGEVDAGMVMEAFRVNSLGPLLLAKHFFEFLPRRGCSSTTASLPEPEPEPEVEPEPEPEPSSSSASASASDQIQLPPHAVWLTMSARLGSTTDNRSGGWFSYRASKAAVNSLTRSLDMHLRMRGAGDSAVAVAYHPGTVRTAFSRDYWAGVPREKLFSPEYAAERLVSVVCGLRTAQRGRCWDWKGEEVSP